MSRVNVGGRKRDARMVKTASELAQPGSPFCPFEPEVQMLRVRERRKRARHGESRCAPVLLRC